MKLPTLLALCLTWPVLASLADESLSIDWYTVDGGGGTTSAGEFTLSGTIGQPDAGMLIPYCRGFSLFGGYWSQFIDVDQPAVPVLCVCLTSTNTFLLSWRAYHQAYNLEKRPTGAPGWDVVPATPVVVLPDVQVTLDDLAGWVATICTNGPGLRTNYVHMTGLEWYNSAKTPAPGCRPPTFYPTNTPTFLRLRK